MAAATNRPSHSKPESIPEIVAGAFKFTISTDVAVPANIPRASAANALPFKGMFANMATLVRDDVSPSSFIPEDYWLKERGADPEKLTGSQQKTKLRDQFNQWTKTDPKYAALAITTMYRDGKNPDYPDKGVAFWISKRPPVNHNETKPAKNKPSGK